METDVQPVVSETTDLFKLLHTLSGSIALLFNVLIAFLTIRHSGPAAATYRYYLLFMQFWILLADVFICFVASFVFFPPSPCGYADGLLYDAAVKLIGLQPIVVLATYLFLLGMNVAGYGACFLYRHHLVTKSTSYNFEKSLNAGIFLFGICVVLGMPLCTMLAYVNVDEQRIIVRNQFSQWDLRSRERLACMNANFPVIITSYIGFVIVVCVVFLIFICGNIFRVLTRNRALSARTAQYHRQMTRNLVIQVLVPLLCIVVPAAVIIGQYLLRIDDPVISLIVFETMSLHSIVHCATLIMTTKRFRLFLTRRLPNPMNSYNNSKNSNSVSIVVPSR